MGRSVLACLLVMLLAAGCLNGRGNEAVANTSPTNATPTTPLDFSGYTILGPTITPGDGRNRSLHEDDVAHVKYAVQNDAATAASFFVSYLHNGVVEDTTTIRLAPGEKRAFDREIAPLYDAPPIRVEVRSGSHSAKAEATVSSWPRTGESVDLGFATFRVERWLKDTTTGDTIVNATIDRKALPEGGSNWFGLHVLCATDKGNSSTRGDARPTLPEPGASGMLDIPLPGCEHLLYGIVITAKDGNDREVYQKILFVDRDWRPAN